MTISNKTISSMTGYASCMREVEGGSLAIELRSVNSRYLDIQIRVEDQLRCFEPLLRETIAASVSRGKIECRVQFEKRLQQGLQASLNEPLLHQLSKLHDILRERFNAAQPMSINELLRYPDVVQFSALQSLTQQEMQTAISQCVHELCTVRAREGAAIAQLLSNRLEQLHAIVKSILPLVPQSMSLFQEKALLRMKEVFTLSLPEIAERLRQEVAMFALKTDIDEELSRLSAHLDETQQALQRGGAVGKRLDFMMQELNREANTLGAKSALKEIASASMEMKLLIEQIREQVQNLE